MSGALRSALEADYTERTRLDTAMTAYTFRMLLVRGVSHLRYFA
jgi:hypothetical protein